ncbi:MAG TPA: YkgJ family cysteine cluster protein [Phycisphaerales bacterium]|nr:YkgJ family cysteine cluster protein [Phycisphaerales bacterium]HMP37311.1 YkgJ family cysteine cluster protein [Phycisphaerales bacterium]
MSARSLPILMPSGAQRYSCHGCGNCCRDFTVQLREEDLDRLRAQRWEERLGEPVTVWFRGRAHLRQRDDGACIFWMEDGRCRIHAEFGLAEKPIACQLFPFSFGPDGRELRVGLSFACQSVQENRGASLESHRAEVRRMLVRVPEAAHGAPPPLAGRLRSTPAEVAALSAALDGILRRSELPLALRLEGFAWMAQMLASARLGSVRERRFGELVETLAAAIPDELALAEPPSPGARAWRLLRQAAFARIEDLRIAEALRRGRLRSILGQLGRSRRFARGRGAMPHRLEGWPTIDLGAVGAVGPAIDPSHAGAIDDLLTRWLRMTLLGGRAWGSGYYGWAIADGLLATTCNLLCTLWLARAHASGHGRAALTVDDCRAALGRVDRHAGRAPWLGGTAERARIRYLQVTEAWRGLVRSLAP